MNEYILKDETYAIIGACMEVHKILGHGFREIVYKDAIEIELQQEGIPYCREKECAILYKGITLQRKFVADFIIYDEVILEVKAAEGGFVSDNISQTINYLKATDNKVGLLVNFGRSKLEYKRLIFSK